jgi:hypothetical protein
MQCISLICLVGLAACLVRTRLIAGLDKSDVSSTRKIPIQTMPQYWDTYKLVYSAGRQISRFAHMAGWMGDGVVCVLGAVDVLRIAQVHCGLAHNWVAGRELWGFLLSGWILFKIWGRGKGDVAKVAPYMALCSRVNLSSNQPRDGFQPSINMYLDARHQFHIDVRASVRLRRRCSPKRRLEEGQSVWYLT